ncbi:hypothetical protein GE09DRAFT_1100341 [Coniochaeta sp. 2T2.1]|nr:hypothetical protein GE09DRAFT_1100341 [Coniochaeta sp. 2T2.1]
MASESQEYAVDDEIAAFFSKTSVPREACDALAKALVGGHQVVPVALQGVCSYTVYAGQDLGYVVQFRLISLGLKTLGGEDSTTAGGGQEPLLIYVMTRIRGVSHLDFILAHGFPEHSAENKTRRKNLAPQKVNQAYRDRMAETFENELQALLVALPDRFRPVVRGTLASLPSILSLPMVLLHKEFGDCNIMVEEESCRLVGVIDWAEAEIGPFGTNLHSLQGPMSKLHLKNGRVRYEDYDDLARSFWETFSNEVGGLSDDTIRAIKAVRVLGLLRSRGFTSRLANMPKPVPIKDDGGGRYNMMILDGLLLNPATRLEGLDECLE